jgi:hypothetical protein
MKGEVAGRQVGPARDAIFVTLEVDHGEAGSIEQIFVLVTGTRQACEAVDKLSKVSYDSCPDWCSSMVSIVGEYIPGEENWDLILHLTQDDDEVSTYTWSATSDPDSFGAEIQGRDYSMFADEGSCIDACTADGSVVPVFEEQTAEGGRVEITDFDAEATASGTYQITFAGNTVEGKFNAGYCDVWEILGEPD